MDLTCFFYIWTGKNNRQLVINVIVSPTLNCPVYFHLKVHYDFCFNIFLNVQYIILNIIIINAITSAAYRSYLVLNQKIPVFFLGLCMKRHSEAV